MTNAAELLGIIIGLNLIFASMVVSFILGSPKGLSTGKVETASTRRSRQFVGFCLFAAGAIFTSFSLLPML